MKTNFRYRKLLSDSGNICLVSIIGNIFLSDAVGQLKFDDLIIANFPNSLVVIPFATGRFDLSLKFYFFDADENADDLIVGNAFLGRLPERFLNDQFDGLEPFALLNIVQVTNIEQVLTILGDQTFGGKFHC